jgi:hypothetical protein
LIASPIGKKIEGTKEPVALCPSDVMHSWHFWIHGSFPRESDSPVGGVELLSVDGYTIYRTMLLDMNLDPESSEIVIVEPRHVVFEGNRFGVADYKGQHVTYPMN